MTDPGLQLEAWTLPNSGTFTRKFDLTRWAASYTLSDRWSGLSDGTLSLPDEFDRLPDLFTIDEADHANDVGSVVRVLRAGLPVGHYVVTRTDDSYSDQAPLVNVGVAGMEWFADRARVHAFDYPADPSTESDWLYGAASVLTTIGGETANELQEIWRGSNVTSGTVKISDGLDVTADLAYNMSAGDLATALELFAGINQVTVRGDGSLKTPYEIEYSDPISAPALYIHTNNTDGDWSVSTTREGGALSERPWIKSTHPVTGQEHGNYSTFQISTTVVPVGDTYSLQIDPDDVDYPTDYAGGQEYVQVTPGHRYRASIPVYAPTTGRTFRLIIRDMSEQFIASSGDILVSPNTWTTLSTGVFTMPPDIHQVIFRVGIIETTNISSVYIGIQSAVLAPGAAAAPLGSILNDLLAPINARGVLTWVTPTWTATHDSAGNLWDRNLNWHIKRGQSILQLLEYAARWRYEWDLRWDSGDDRFELDVFNPAAGGTNLSGTVTVSGRDGGVGSGPIVRRIPDLTHALAEGDLGRWGEYSATPLASTWGRLEGYFGNKTGADSTGLASLAQALTDKATADTSGRRLQLMDPSKLPWTDYQPGDTVTVNLAPKDTKQALRVMQVTVTGGNTSAPVYDVHAASIVLDPESALVDTVRSLARQFRGLEDVPENDRTLDPATYQGGGGGGFIPGLVVGFDAPAEWVRVAHFVCDGTSDQIELQAALDAGLDQVLVVGQLYLDIPNGSYAVSNPAYTDLVGVGLGSGLNDAANTTPTVDSYLIRNAGTIRNLGLYTFNDFAHVVQHHGAAGLAQIDGCWVEATGDASCVRTGNSGRLQIVGSELDTTSTTYPAVYLGAMASNNTIILRGNHIRGGLHNIQTASTTSPVLIDGNWLEDAEQDSVLVASTWAKVVNNNLQGAGAGLTGSETVRHAAIRFQDVGEGGHIVDNTIEGVASAAGITVSGSDEIIIDGNRLEDVGQHGIRIHNSDRVQVVGNVGVRIDADGGATPRHGVFVEGTSANSRIHLNDLSMQSGGAANGVGVYVEASAVTPMIVGNRLFDWVTAPIVDLSGTALLSWPNLALYGDNFVGTGPAYGGGLYTPTRVTISLPTPKISTHGATPAPVTVAVSVPQAGRGQSNSRTPNPVTVTVTLPQSTQTTGGTRTPTPVTVAITLPTGDAP